MINESTYMHWAFSYLSSLEFLIPHLARATRATLICHEICFTIWPRRIGFNQMGVNFIRRRDKSSSSFFHRFQSPWFRRCESNLTTEKCDATNGEFNFLFFLLLFLWIIYASDSIIWGFTIMREIEEGARIAQVLKKCFVCGE